MRAFRRESLGWLGLFALALQLALSFGHVHNHASHAPTAAAQTCAKSDPTACPARDPAHGPAHDNDGDDEQHCSICWTIAMAGSLVLAAPADIGPPAPVAAPPRTPTIIGQLRDSASVKFQARAPPLPSIA